MSETGDMRHAPTYDIVNREGAPRLTGSIDEVKLAQLRMNGEVTLEPAVASADLAVGDEFSLILDEKSDSEYVKKFVVEVVEVGPADEKGAALKVKLKKIVRPYVDKEEL